MKYFRFPQYVCLKKDKTPQGIMGYSCKGYILEGDDIFLISGDANIKHDINDLKESYRTHIIQLIDSMEDKIFN